MVNLLLMQFTAVAEQALKFDSLSSRVRHTDSDIVIKHTLFSQLVHLQGMGHATVDSQDHCTCHSPCFAGPAGISTNSSMRSRIASAATTAATTGNPSSSGQSASTPTGSKTSLGPAALMAESSSRSSIAQGALRPVPAAAAAAAPMPQRPASPDVNLVLVSAADWGSAGNGGYVPADSPDIKRPDEKQIKEECRCRLWL